MFRSLLPIATAPGACSGLAGDQEPARQRPEDERPTRPTERASPSIHAVATMARCVLEPDPIVNPTLVVPVISPLPDRFSWAVPAGPATSAKWLAGDVSPDWPVMPPDPL